MGKSCATSTSSMLRGVPGEAVLGEGQFGLVWRARGRATGAWYAVKSIHVRSRDTEIISRECEIAEHVRLRPHPNLVQFFRTHSLADGRLRLIVMELCLGGDLQTRIRSARSVARCEGRVYDPPQRSFRWVSQIYQGLVFLHNTLVLLFRDLKPRNVLLTSQGEAKLTDFGMGHHGLESTGAWSFGFPAGTPGYMAPE